MKEFIPYYCEDFGWDYCYNTRLITIYYKIDDKRYKYLRERDIKISKEFLENVPKDWIVSTLLYYTSQTFPRNGDLK